MLYIYLPIFVTFLLIIKKKYKITVFDQVLWPKEIVWPRENLFEHSYSSNYDCEKNDKLD